MGKCPSRTVKLSLLFFPVEGQKLEGLGLFFLFKTGLVEGTMEKKGFKK